MKKYNLKVNKIITILIISSIFFVLAVYMMFYATQEEKFNMFKTELVYSIRNGQALFGTIYICGLLAIPVIIYMLKLLMYRIKDVLIFSKEGITYFAPEYKKVYIQKEQIKDIYISNGQLKILLNNYKIKENFKIKIWKNLKNLLLGYNAENIFRINLGFIKCNEDDIRQVLIDFDLDIDISEAKQIIEKKCKQYNCVNIEEIKKNEEILIECIMELYYSEKLTQNEIAAMLNESTSKVSKIIRQNLE